jgi:hypothetical protein
MPFAIAADRSLTRARRGQRARWAWFLALALGHAGCGDSTPSVPDGGSDAAIACEAGELACACTGTGGCRDGLFCLAGRCLPAENPGPNEPNVPRPPLNPMNPVALDAAAPAPVEDAAPATLDATPPVDGSASPPDASADAG